MQVPDCEAPQFWERMDKLVALSSKLSDIEKSQAPSWLKNVRKVPVLQGFATQLVLLFFAKSIRSGSYDTQAETQLVY